MTYKKRFRKTKNHRSFRGNNTYKKRRMHKTTLKKGGTSTATQIFNTISAQGVSMTDQQKNEILSSIDTFIKSNNVHAQDTGIIGRKTNALMESVTSGLDGSIEVIGKWLIPGKSSVGKKNMSEIIVYFFPSLVKSKPGDNNKPKLRHGSIMVKTNNQFTDITHFVRSMTRDTDDMIAEMTRGATYPLGRKPYHTERFRISERLDDEWNYNPKGDAAINVMAEKTVNNLKSELESKKRELDNQKKELQKAKENKESHEKSAKELAKELKKVNEDLKKNKGNEAKIQELEKQKAEIQIELATAKTEVETSKKEIDDGKTSLELVSKDLKTAKSEVELKDKENADLKKNLEELKNEHDKLQKEKDLAIAKVSELEQKSAEKEAELLKTNEIIMKLEGERTDLEMKLQNTSRSNDESITTKESQLSDISKKLKAAEAEKKKLEKNAAKVKAELVEATNAATAKENELDAAKKDLALVQQKQSDTDATNAAEIEKLKSELQQKIVEKVKKEEELVAEKAEKERLAAEKDKKDKELAIEKAEKDRLALEKTQKDKELAIEKAEKERLALEKTQKEQELEKKKKELSDKEAEFKRQQADVEYYQKDKTAFQETERSNIKYNIIADKIRVILSTMGNKGKISNSANPIPDGVIPKIKEDIRTDETLLSTWNLSNAYDIDVKLTSIADKLATNSKYQQKYIRLFSEKTTTTPRKGSDVTASARGQGGGGSGGGGQSGRGQGGGGPVSRNAAGGGGR